MIFGSVAYRGVFKRRSAEMIAGNLVEMVSRPPSTSRVTEREPEEMSILEANVAWMSGSRPRAKRGKPSE
jgi:hypothetical protein